MHDAADDSAIVRPLDAPDIRRQVRLDPLPLLIAQPKQVAAHDPNPLPKTNQDRIVRAQKLMSSDPSSVSKGWAGNPDYRSDTDLHVALDKATSDYVSSKQDADKAEKHRDDALDKIALAKAKIGQYEKLLSEQRAALIIVSKYDGRFTSRVALGSFVRRGHTLGEITI